MVFHLTDVRIEHGLRACRIPTSQDRHCIPAPDQAFEVVGGYLLGATAQVKNVGEIDCVLAADHVRCQKPGGPQNHRQAAKMSLIHERLDTTLQLAEGLLDNSILVLPGLKIAP